MIIIINIRSTSGLSKWYVWCSLLFTNGDAQKWSPVHELSTAAPCQLLFRLFGQHITGIVVHFHVVTKQIVRAAQLGNVASVVDGNFVENARGRIKDETVDARRRHGFLLVAEGLPASFLDHFRLVEIEALLDDIQFNQTSVLGLLVGNGVQLFLVEAVNVANVLQPGVQHLTVILLFDRRANASTVVVSRDKNVLDLQVFDGVGEDRQYIEIGRN